MKKYIYIITILIFAMNPFIITAQSKNNKLTPELKKDWLNFLNTTKESVDKIRNAYGSGQAKVYDNHKVLAVLLLNYLNILNKDSEPNPCTDLISYVIKNYVGWDKNLSDFLNSKKFNEHYDLTLLTIESTRQCLVN